VRVYVPCLVAAVLFDAALDSELGGMLDGMLRCCGVPDPLALLYDEDVSFAIAASSDIDAS
jgi:hypothetical protein